MPKPKVVLDTNVLVSSLWGGVPLEVVRRWRDGRDRLLVSRPVIREYLEVLGRFVSSADLAEWAYLLGDATRTLRVTPRERITAIRDDPDDNRFLECAVAGHAEAIVSGDRHLIMLSSFQAIPILTPAAFIKRFPG